jgi:hypothetical protein
MPVTAKLSQKFYERLGDDIANELVDWFNQVDATYRNDLRDFNEMNFQRFDARLEQRIAASEARLDNRISELRAEMQVGFTTLEARLDTGLAGLDTRFATFRAHIEERLGAQQSLLEERLDAQQGRLDKRLDGMDKRLDTMVTHLGAQVKWMFGFWVTTLITLGGLMVTLNQLGG